MRVLVVAALLLFVTAAAPLLGADAAAPTIRPGVRTHTAGNQCTANFVFTNGVDLFIGQAAHCATLGAATDTNGCTTPSRAVGTPVTIDGASRPGTLAYSSWRTMQARGEWDGLTCAYNDFALVRIDPADHAAVSGSVLHFGGPIGMAPAVYPGFGKHVLSYGDSSLLPEVEPSDWKEGYVVGGSTSNWIVLVEFAVPGVPGDSGSPVLLDNGRALGLISTLQAVPYPANTVVTLEKAVGYANAHGGLGTLSLVTAPLVDNGNLVGL